MTALPNALAMMLLAACAFLGGCVSIGRDARPDYPPPIDPHIYDIRIAQTKRLAMGERPMMSIGGARIAAGGIYVDLVIVNREPVEGIRLGAVSSGLGEFFSDLDDPGELIEIRDHRDRVVRLRPAQRPRWGGFFMPGTIIDPVHVYAPQYVVESNPKMALVDVCIFRTDHQLASGRFSMRLRSQLRNEGNEGRLSRIGEIYSTDGEWRTFDVQVVQQTED